MFRIVQCIVERRELEAERRAVEARRPPPVIARFAVRTAEPTLAAAVPRRLEVAAVARPVVARPVAERPEADRVIELVAPLPALLLRVLLPPLTVRPTAFLARLAKPRTEVDAFPEAERRLPGVDLDDLDVCVLKVLSLLG
jgi:hypothetical protein